MEHRKEKHSKGWLITSVSLMLFSVCLAVSLVFSLAHNGRTQQALESTYEQNLY